MNASTGTSRVDYYAEPAGEGSRVASIGIAYYYNTPAVNLAGIRAMPANLRIVAGGRSMPASRRSWFWNCSREPDNKMRSSPPNCGALDIGYLRLHVAFPNCRNGWQLDSANHRSHMPWPISSSACPATHTVKLPRLLQNYHFRGLRNGTQYSQITPSPRMPTSGTPGTP